MRPVSFPEQNTVATGDGCSDLPLYAGGGQFVSVWELSGDELMQVLQTGRIYVRTFGPHIPPIALQVESPFIQGGST